MIHKKNNGKKPDPGWEKDLEKAAQKVGRKDLKNRLKALEKKNQSNSKVFFFPKFLKYAAAVVALISASMFWFSNQNYSNNSLVEKYYQEPNFTGLRGDSAQDYQAAVELFYKGDLEKSIALLSSKEATPQEQFMKGIAYLKLDKYEEAEATFENLWQTSTNGWIEKGKWFHALTLLKKGDQKNAEILLKELTQITDSPFEEKTKELLEKMNSSWRKLTF